MNNAVCHFTRLSRDHAVTGADLVDFAAGKEAARLIALESARFEVHGLGVSALDPALSARVYLEDLDHGLDLVVVVSCAHHFEGRDLTIDVKRCERDGVAVQVPVGLVNRIRDWLESERRKGARAVWEAL